MSAGEDEGNDRAEESEPVEAQVENPLQTYLLKSEDEAWKLLDGILKKEIDADKIRIDFSEADWAQFRIRFSGKAFDQTITPSSMQGLVDLQLALYRSIAIATRSGNRVSNLTDKEKEAFELVFKVSKGSTNLLAEAKEVLDSLSKVFEHMTGAQKTAVLLVIAVLFFGTAGFNSYLTHVGDTKKTALEEKKVSLEEKKATLDSENAKGLRDIISKLAEDKAELARAKILQEAKNQDPRVSEIDDQASDGFDSIVRHNTKVESLTIQGREINRRTIEDITSVSRRRATKVNFRSTYTIDGVDSTDPKGFVVKLRDIGSERVITATLFDQVGKAKFASVIQKAEWGKTKIVVQITGRQIGDEIREAKIMRAHTARIRRAD